VAYAKFYNGGGSELRRAGSDFFVFVVVVNSLF